MIATTAHPGAYIHKLRMQHDLTLAQLAEKVQLTSSMLSKLENCQADPSLGTLRKIAAVLNVPLAHFFVDGLQTERILHLGDRLVMQARNAGVTYEFFHPIGNAQIEFSQVIAAPGGGVADLDSHSGEESALVLSGTLHLEIGEAEYVLEPNDSIYWDSTKPHRWHNPGPGELKVIFVGTPTSVLRT